MAYRFLIRMGAINDYLVVPKDKIRIMDKEYIKKHAIEKFNELLNQFIDEELEKL